MDLDNRCSIVLEMEKIDFVVLWVDSSDPEWIKLYNQYRPENPLSDRGRFRDWDIFRYWFRAVERYAPWVNNVFLVTNGTFPKWINKDCPKLKLVSHKDFIPEKYLPLFNSCAIELNIDKIEGLSEHFVYFNDDVFLNSPTTPEDYFRDGLPCDCNDETLFRNPWYNIVNGLSIQIQTYMDVAVVNRHFNRMETIRKAKWKWFGPHLWNKSLISNLMLLRHENFEAFELSHIEHSMLKSVLKEIWEKEPGIMEKSCTRFRNVLGLNQYVVRYWQFASNRFSPVKKRDKDSFFILSTSVIDRACATLQKGKVRSVCLNDTPHISDEDKLVIEGKLKKVFQEKFPNKSMFEKQDDAK